MLAAVITGPSYREAKAQIEKALPHVDCMEFRFDLIKTQEIGSLIEDCSLPVIFTLRGGSLEERERLLALKPDYMDIEHNIPFPIQKYPKTRFICSYHDFDKTPHDLAGLLSQLQRPGISLYKIAAFANSSLDALRMLIFSREAGKNVSGICMGENGQLTRILGPVVENAIDYACLEKNENSLGQIDFETLIRVYGYKKLNSQTELFALIGEPIRHSIGHFFHNEKFQNRNAIYVKMPLKKDELSSFFDLIHELPFRGLSVTTPLKEAVCDYLDGGKKSAVNTVIVEGGKKIGLNTDGRGALNALEELTGCVREKKISILGAGGTSCAVSEEALRRGAEVTILNRTEQKAIDLAARLGCRGGGLEKLSSCDILINATATEMPIDQIKSCKIVMDLNYGMKETLFISEGKRKGCICIDGKTMFRHQALLQQELFKLKSII